MGLNVRAKSLITGGEAFRTGDRPNNHSAHDAEGMGRTYKMVQRGFPD